MRHVEANVNNHEIIMETFNNFTEFLNIVNSRETLWMEHNVPNREIHDYSSRRCNSYEEACNMLQYGTSEGLERMKSRVGELQKHGTRKKTRRFNDVVGFAPIVANALLGIPNAMVNCERRPINSKVITICYEPSVSGATSADKVFEFGCRFVNAIMNLEENGFRVRVDYLKTDMDCGRIYALRVPIKNEHQPINLKRLMFPMTHVAMQRYLSWEWLEKLPNSRSMWGYGHALYGASSEEKRALTEMLNENEYLIHYDGSDIEDVLKQLDIN